jgi:hypothetical protein
MIEQKNANQPALFRFWQPIQIDNVFDPWVDGAPKRCNHNEDCQNFIEGGGGD